MFAATITLTIGGSAHVLNRINQDSYGSEYLYSGTLSKVSMKIRHSQDSPDGDNITMLRHNVFAERVIYPTATDLMKKQTFTGTLRGGRLESPVICADLAQAVTDWLDTAGVLTSLSVGEN